MARVAIITGATGGLGTEFVSAVNKWDDIDEIWAVGRNTDKLNDLSDLYKKAVVINADLLKNGTEVLSEKIAALKPDIKLLINNAGAGYFGLYEKMDSSKVEDYCNLNCTVPSMLISCVLPFMSEGAGIINISSASSFHGFISLIGSDHTDALCDHDHDDCRKHARSAITYKWKCHTC